MDADLSDTQGLERVIRALATAARSLRLYPPTSPIPAQTLEAAEHAVRDALLDEPVLVVSIQREGLAWRGGLLGKHTPGSRELADELRSHGVAEIAFVGTVGAEEIREFLSLASDEPADVIEQGGFSALLVGRGVEGIRVTEVQLTVTDGLAPETEEDAEDFLLALASDPERLGAWMSASAVRDPAIFQEHLAQLVEVAGPDGRERLLATLARAFADQPQETWDVLLRLAFSEGAARDLVGGVMPLLGSDAVAAALVDGSLGVNVLSLSNALAKLPLEQTVAQVRERVQARLREAGHGAAETSYLEHMLEARWLLVPEPPVSDSDRTYRAVAKAAAVNEEDVVRARDAVVGSIDGSRVMGVKTLLCLLDHEDDFDLYCATATNLGAMVPRLLEAGELTLSAEVLQELSSREGRATGPWPELSARLREAIAGGVGPESMGILVDALAADRSLMPAAREILLHAGEAAGPSLVSAAIAGKGQGLEIAEELLGRRVIDLLNAAAPQVPWYQLGPVVAHLAREGDPRSMETIALLLRRPDEQSRREVVTALAASGNASAVSLMAQALHDPSAEVSIIAARAIGKSGDPSASAVLAERLAEIEGDSAAFVLGREIIGALSRIPGPEADEALQRLATKRSFVKRARLAELQELAKHALDVRQGGGQA